MATDAEWSVAFARQADADFRTWRALNDSQVRECHKLLLLQMACEKLCKAHLVALGTPASKLQSSHGYVAGSLPLVIRQQVLRRGGDLTGVRSILVFARHLASEIELLNPAVKRAGRRPDNCECPWEDGKGQIRSPLDWTFAPSQLLTQRHGITLVKLMQSAIAELLE
jgi:hypothetical protein